jgi:23S rRNA pseudouridine2457 synthase
MHYEACLKAAFQVKDGGMILAFHKPYGVLSQFTKQEPGHRTLAEFGFPKEVYPVGRLDWDSEGLLLLSDEKEWNDFLLNPKHSHPRIYHAQVEGIATEKAIGQLQKGVVIQGRKTQPCKARLLSDPGYAPRNPPIRFRLSVPTSWIELQLTEGKNRQVRRMGAAVGFPVLRLIRTAIGRLELGSLEAGKWFELSPAQRALLKKGARL